MSCQLQQFHLKLLGRPFNLSHEPKESLHEDILEVSFTRNRLDKVSVGCIRKVVHNPKGGIPSILQHFRFSTKEVPQRRTTEAAIVDFIEMKLGVWMAMLELLNQIIILGDVLGPLHSNIMLHPINLILKIVAKM